MEDATICHGWHIYTDNALLHLFKRSNDQKFERHHTITLVVVSNKKPITDYERIWRQRIWQRLDMSGTLSGTFAGSQALPPTHSYCHHYAFMSVDTVADEMTVSLMNPDSNWEMLTAVQM